MNSLIAPRSLSIPFRCGVSRSGRARLAFALLAGACAAPVPRPAPELVPPAIPAVTGGGSRDYARIEAEVLVALNTARTSPSTAAGWLEELIPRFNGTRLSRSDWSIVVQTVEGVAAVREGIAALRAQAPVRSLTLDPLLTRAARDHAADQGRTGQTGHAGSDGSTVLTRIARYATWRVTVNENIDYAPMVSGRNVIESLLIDDGVRDRGHRRNIYSPVVRAVGIACGPHPRYTATCVIVQAGGVDPKR
jgi:uncharacterized protein YkwD